MSTEQLIIELDARTAKLDAKLNKVERNLDGVENKTKKADRAFVKFSSGFNKMDIDLKSILTGSATAILALSAAVTAMTLSSAKNRRELELLAGQAKTSTSDFQALSFATSKYGIDAEKIADISKDIADKIGEFSAAGTGAFQDYADVMKLSKDQAREAAQEFEGLSSQEILGKMVSRMEDASVSGDKMTFVLESLGSDASRLIPLFKGNSSELKELKKRFDDVNKSLQITGEQADALRDVSNTFTLMTSSIGNATTAISATLAPAFDDFFNEVIDIVPQATQTIINFVNSMQDPKNINKISDLVFLIAESQQRLNDSKIELLELQKKEATNNSTILQSRGMQEQILKQSIKDEKEKTESYNDQILALEKIIETKKLDKDKDKDKSGTVEIDRGTGTGEEKQAIADRFKAEEVLLAEKLNRELLIIGDNDELKKQLAEKFAEDIKSMREAERSEISKELLNDFDVKLKGQKSTLKLLEDERSARKEILSAMYADDTELSAEQLKEKNSLLDKINQDYRDKIKEATQTEDAAKEETIINELKQQEEFLNANLVSQQVFQEKLKEIIGEYSPETLDPSILEKQNQDELNLLNDKLEKQLISYESYFKDLKKLQDKDAKDKEKDKDTELKWSTSSNKKLMDDGTALLTSLGNNSKTAHKIKQGLAASNTVMATAENITSQFPNPAGMAIAAATGAAQLAAILSSSPNSPGGSSSAGAPSPQAQIAQPQNIEEETSNLEFTEQTEGGITTQRLVLSLENGQDLFDGIIEGTEQRRRTGR